MRTVRQASASFECCRDHCFGLIGRHADIDVGPATPRPGRAEAFGTTRAGYVGADRRRLLSVQGSCTRGLRPKRTYVATCVLCHRNADDLDLGGVRLDPQLPSFCRNLACQLDIKRPLRSSASSRAQTEGQALFSAERSLSSISHAWSSVWKAECRMRNGSVHDRMRFATSPAL
jgi:hypothetical protein